MIDYPYPSFTQATAGATLAYQILVGGQSGERKAELAHSLYVVQGYATSRVLPVAFGATDNDEDSLCFDNLENALYTAADLPIPMSAQREGRRDWSKLLELVQKLLPIILPLVI